MVFCCRCLSVRMEYETSTQENTRGGDFDATPLDSNMTPPVAQNICNQRSDDVPSVNARSSTLRVFTLVELRRATRNFDQSTKIGEGQRGSVHTGVIKSLEHPFDDIRVVVKGCKTGQKGEHRVWEAQVKALGEIKHPNIVKLIGYCNEDYKNWSLCFLVYEYMPNGTLDVHLASNEPLSWGMRLIIAQDAATSLAYLHEGFGREVIFRDFKPSNILLDSQMNAKLSEFGFAKERSKNGVVQTKGYPAPEYVKTGRLTTKIDVWDYGIFLQELITGGLPLAQENSDKNPECMRLVCCYAEKSKLPVDPRLEGKYSENSVEKVASIANKCLVKEPKLRPKMSEVLKLVEEAIALEMLNPQLSNA